MPVKQHVIILTVLVAVKMTSVATVTRVETKAEELCDFSLKKAWDIKTFTFLTVTDVVNHPCFKCWQEGKKYV